MRLGKLCPKEFKTIRKKMEENFCYHQKEKQTRRRRYAACKGRFSR